jgi:hypothetical protein
LQAVYNIEDHEILAALNDLLLKPVLLFETQPVLNAFISVATGKNFDLADLQIMHFASASSDKKAANLLYLS